jgi:hypothetical protein
MCADLRRSHNRLRSGGRIDMADARTDSCVHHWVLGLPEDDIIRGRCKRCGARREYPASVEGASRQGVYDEAASLNKSVGLLPDFGGDKLPGRAGAW